MALVKDVLVTEFRLEADVLSTKPDYPHRSMTMFFGYQDPDHFYYVHFGKKTDDHANQIFIVNGAARVKISTKTTDGTNWDDNWHHVKIERNPADPEAPQRFQTFIAGVAAGEGATLDVGHFLLPPSALGLPGLGADL